MKRLMDTVLSITALIILSPLLLGVACLIRLNLGSSVLFKQERIGYRNQPFIIYKFRTMSDECDREGNLLPDSARLTALGKLIRSLSIDEIPQLVNVIKGDMSIVGPRPLLPRYLPYYTECERKRHDVRPGITGFAQISGRNDLGWDKRLELDIHYVENYSLFLDMKIIVLTFLKVVRRENVIESPGDYMLDLDVERK